MTVGTGEMKWELALNSIAAGYRSDWVTAFQTPWGPASDGGTPDWPPLAGGPDWKLVSSRTPEPDMSLSPANAERLKQAFAQCRDMEGTLSEQLEAYAAAGREIFPAYGDAADRR